VPELERLPLTDGVTVLGFPSAGHEAVNWWRRLRRAHEETGFWPVLIPSVEEAVRPSGAFGTDPGRGWRGWQSGTPWRC
jgi:hypothetical protein